MVTTVTLTADPRMIALEAEPDATTWLAPFAEIVLFKIVEDDAMAGEYVVVSNQQRAG